jgi:Flp pilus assembly protein TadB
MLFALILTATLAGLATTIGLWPIIGPMALLAAPLGASLATLIVAAVLARRAPARPKDELEEIADQLVADLKRVSRAIPLLELDQAPTRRRKAG